MQLLQHSFFKIILVLLLVSCTKNGLAQPSDVISLRKKGRAVQTFFAGDHIAFGSTSGAYRDALITAIKKDSIYLQEFSVQKVMMTYGGYILDTVGSYRFQYHYKEIQRFGRKPKGFNLVGSAGALVGGGILLTAASAVVFLADRKRFSWELMAAGAGAAILGYAIGKAATRPIIVGKRGYTISYMNLQK